MLSRAEKYANAEERFQSKKGREKGESSKNKKTKEDRRDVRPGRPDQASRKNQFRPRDQLSSQEPRSRPPVQFTNYTELNAPREHILMQMKNSTLFKAPPPLKSDRSRRNQKKYCHFYKDVGHDTSECFDLKEQIESLVRQGQLQGYVKGQSSREHRDLPESSRKDKGKKKENYSDENMSVVNHIWGGPFAGNSGKARKNLARQARHEPNGLDINLTDRLQNSRFRDTPIIFSEEDTRGIHHPHCDALVVTLPVANKRLHRILIDNGSSADILFLSAFTKMGLERSQLMPYTTQLHGFAGGSVIPEGMIELAVSFGKTPTKVTSMVRFIVVDQPSAYNSVLG